MALVKLLFQLGLNMNVILLFKHGITRSEQISLLWFLMFDLRDIVSMSDNVNWKDVAEELRNRLFSLYDDGYE
jgi:hypothetical protein